jgi:long-chain-fatty-acid--[acyl-carrier-protein] ligase
LKPIPRKWFRPPPRRRAAREPLPGGRRLFCAPGETIPAAFLACAARDPARAALADQAGGVKTYRDVVLGVLALRPTFDRLPGERLGIMLPASAAAAVTYLAALFAGKTPVMVNWTVGRRHMRHALEAVGVRRIVTARALVDRLESRREGLGDLRERFVCLEDFAAGLTRLEKLRALAGSRLWWRSLARADVRETAAILFTSGSETVPKAVPLTHANLLANIRGVLGVVHIGAGDAMLCILPPFHALGLAGNIVAPLVAGIRAAYHPDPNDAATIARLAQAYAATILVATPSFLGRTVRAADAGQLDTLRVVITGAEACPQRLYDALAECCRGAAVVEGYGLTECSPIVAVNDPGHPRPLTIGRALPSFECAIVDPDTNRPVPPGSQGMLLVRGPSVFGGYLAHDGPSPFVEFRGHAWYRTGDLVSRDDDGVMTFRGRLKRFVKIGGEMVSLPAVEVVLEPHYASEEDEAPALAVVASGGGGRRAELVLVTTRPVDRQTVNRQIREAGLSPLHNVRRVVTVESLPLLGTGKVDYRRLEKTLREDNTAAG